jgi:hypothetical protein
MKTSFFIVSLLYIIGFGKWYSGSSAEDVLTFFISLSVQLYFAIGQLSRNTFCETLFVTTFVICLRKVFFRGKNAQLSTGFSSQAKAAILAELKEMLRIQMKSGVY